MTQIPSHLPASAAQTGIQANEVAKEREARRTGQTDTARRQMQTVDESDTTVDTEDADVAIYADAEGTGSQGREAEGSPAAQETAEDAAEPETGITRDGDGRLHVDLEA